MSDEFSSQFRNEPRGEGGQYKKELVEALTGMWNTATSGNSIPVYNKKLHVRHVVEASANPAAPPGAGASGGLAGAGGSSLPSKFQDEKPNNTEKMSPDQLSDEVASLRRKYDELVAFSVNLTAERDILNNTLEQTKRDLNRETATRTALEKQQGKLGRSAQDKKSNKGGGAGVSIKSLLLVVVLAFLLAVKATNSGSTKMLKNVPVLGGLLGFECCNKHKKNKEPKSAGVGRDEL